MSGPVFPSISNSHAFKAITSYIQSWPKSRPQITIENWKNECIKSKHLTYHYVGRSRPKGIEAHLQNLADECQLIAQYNELRKGAIYNPSENRAVQHHALRGPQKESFFAQEWTRMQATIDDINARHSTIDTVIQIGIGGSELGPKLLIEALKPYALSNGLLNRKAIFLSNIDSDAIMAAINGVDLTRTLWIVVSKSGTTLETLSIFDFLLNQLPEEINQKTFIRQQVLTVTSNSADLASRFGFLDSFFITDSIGGRYSISSACGLLVGGLAYGSNVMSEFLHGAYDMDQHAENPNVMENMVVWDAIWGVVDRNIHQHSAQAIIPYASSLQLLPPYLQQLENESNGKSVNRQNQPIEYPTSHVIFGEVGTNAQHSFFQYLHQGNPVIPIQMIGFKQANGPQESGLHVSLLANLMGQLIAFSEGQASEDPNTSFKGGRPVSLLAAQKLTPSVIGALISFYENTTMFKGFLWNVNSFDQAGVTLGKQVAQRLLDPHHQSDHTVVFSDFRND